MERQTLRGGNLKSAGYDRERRVLQVEMADGRIVEYRGVGQEMARRLLASQSPLSYFRDNIEDEFHGTVVGRTTGSSGASNPFGQG